MPKQLRRKRIRLKTFMISFLTLILVYRCCLRLQASTSVSLVDSYQFQVHQQPVKVLLYITTLYSERHRHYLKCCWPRLLRESEFLRNVDIIFFSNNSTSTDPAEDYLRHVEESFYINGAKSVGFKFASNTTELDVLGELSKRAKINPNSNHKQNVKQWGANMALSIGFSSGWFSPYDWVLRLNPDVLIRHSGFIRRRLLDDSVDAILALCGTTKVNTDFFGFRPRAMLPGAFSKMLNNSPATFNHESTAKMDFLHICKAKRFVPVPGLDPMNGKCRVRGRKAPVYHAHDSCLKNSSMKCNALEGWSIQ